MTSELHGIWRGGTLLVALSSALGVGSCTVVTDPSDVQCENDGDCAKFGPGLCSAAKVCVSLACSSTAECQGRVDGPAYCRSDGACVPLLTEDCTRVYPAEALDQEDVILFGFMAPITDPDTYGLGPLDGVEFALNDFAEVAPTGLPGATGGGRSRRLAMLVCHHGDEGEQAVEVARHLAHVVKVPAIIGPAYSGITLRVFELVTRAAGALLMSPSATSPDLTSLKQADSDLLLWRTVPSDSVQAETLKSLAPEVANAVRAAAGTGSDAPVEFGITYKEDNAGRGLIEQVTFPNDAFPNAVAGVEVEHTASYADQKADFIDWEGVWEDLIETGYPQVILPLGTEEFASKLLPIIEEEWPRGRARPWYLMPEGNRGGALQNFARQHPELGLEERVLGTAPGARRTALYEQFGKAFQQSARRAPRNLAEFGYDAAYLLAYAVLQSRKQFPTGRELGRALTRMTCKGGEVIKASSRDLLKGINVVTTAECLDFEGASGPVDFEGSAREVLADIALWCVRTEEGVTVDQNLETYYAVTDFPDASGGSSKGLVRRDPAGGLDLTAQGWCNANTAGR